jgi:hypothetical protein
VCGMRWQWRHRRHDADYNRRHRGHERVSPTHTNNNWPIVWGGSRVELVDQVGQDGWPWYYVFTDFWYGPGVAMVTSEGYIP